MDAVFINSFPEGQGINEATIEPPLGLAYIAAVLEKKGFCCDIIDANLLGLRPGKVLASIPSGTRLIGFYLNSFNFNSVRETARLCGEAHKDALILIGGPLASSSPMEVLSTIPCHGLIRGEGEYAVLRIMENLAADCDPFDPEISGAVYWDNGILKENPVRRIRELSELPFPAYHLLPSIKKYKSRSRKWPVGAIVTTRGCAHDCIFCSKDIFNREVTFRSPENVLLEIDFLVNRYGIRQLDILDDNFAQKRSHMEAILDGIIQRNYDLSINLQAGIRAELLDEKMLLKMKKAGVFKLAFGIESADPAVLKVCRKNLNLNNLAIAVRLAKKHGFQVYGFFIIGLPGETEESFLKTMEYAEKLDLDIANFTIAVPFIGTELFRMVKAQGRFLIDTTKNIGSGFYGGQAFFEYGNNSKEDILRRYRTAYKRFYSFKKKMRLIVGIKSWSEFRWYVNVSLSVLKGMSGLNKPTEDSNKTGILHEN